MWVCHGVLLMLVIQLDQTLNKWRRNIKLQKILDLFSRHIMATKIQSYPMRREWTNIQVQNQLLCIHRWEAMDSRNTNILEVLVKTRLKIKSMISLLSSSELRKWKELFSYAIRKIMEAPIDIQLLTWLWISKKGEKQPLDFIRNSQFIDQEVLHLQMSKMTYKLFGTNKFLFVQKIEFQEKLWALLIIIQLETKTHRDSISMEVNTRD